MSPPAIVSSLCSRCLRENGKGKYQADFQALEHPQEQANASEKEDPLGEEESDCVWGSMPRLSNDAHRWDEEEHEVNSKDNWTGMLFRFWWYLTWNQGSNKYRRLYAISCSQVNTYLPVPKLYIQIQGTLYSCVCLMAWNLLHAYQSYNICRCCINRLTTRELYCTVYLVTNGSNAQMADVVCIQVP